MGETCPHNPNCIHICIALYRKLLLTHLIASTFVLHCIKICSSQPNCIHSVPIIWFAATYTDRVPTSTFFSPHLPNYPKLLLPMLIREFPHSTTSPTLQQERFHDRGQKQLRKVARNSASKTVQLQGPLPFTGSVCISQQN